MVEKGSQRRRRMSSEDIEFDPGYSSEDEIEMSKEPE